MTVLISAKGRVPRQGGLGPRATVPRPLAPLQQKTMPRNGQVHRTEIVLEPGGSHPGPNHDNITLED